MCRFRKWKKCSADVGASITFRRALNRPAVQFDQSAGGNCPESGSLCVLHRERKRRGSRRHNCDTASWALPPRNQIEANLLADATADEIGEYDEEASA